MIRKIFVALSAAAFEFVVAISILAHCGSTWVTHAPTFGPQLTRADCTTGGARTITSKSVTTTIHWTVGQPITEAITDFGENKIVIGSFGGDGCARCFPIFEAPQWKEERPGVTEWRQLTWKQTVGAENQCLQGFARGAIVHRFERNCSPTEEECEADFNWFWNPINDGCQEEGPAPCFLEPMFCDPGSWNFEWCGCIPYSSPIVIDLAGNGFNLTNATGGVVFNLNVIGGKEKLAWTSSGSDDAWLVLDRNGNGTIDDGTELFGDLTPQPDPPTGEKKNGFLALAEYDKPANGGNANGQIENGDSIFPSLRLWRDTNHDGLTQPAELHPLPSQNVAALELDYKLSKKTDHHGNRFAFRAKVKGSQGQQVGRWAWDVYLVRPS